MTAKGGTGVVNSKGKSHARYPKLLQTKRWLASGFLSGRALPCTVRGAGYRYTGCSFRYPRASLSPEVLPILGGMALVPRRRKCISTRRHRGATSPSPLVKIPALLSRASMVMNFKSAWTCPGQCQFGAHSQTWARVLRAPSVVGMVRTTKDDGLGKSSIRRGYTKPGPGSQGERMLGGGRVHRAIPSRLQSIAAAA